MENPPASLSADPEYRFRPGLIGGESVFRLTPDALEFEGRRNSRVRYRDIARVRLSYRPANLAARRFLAEVWPREGSKLTLASVSAKGPFNFESKDADYRAFVTELCKRIGAAQPKLALEAGMPWWRFWPAAVFGVITVLAVVYLVATAAFSAKFSFAAACAALGGILVWQISGMLLRNHPQRCGMDSIPAKVLPS